MFGPLLTLLALAATPQENFSLSWRVPCASAPDVTELVGASTGAVAVEVGAEASSWLLVVRFLAPVTGERIIRTQTCEEAAQAALLVVRLAARGHRHPLALPAPPVVEAPPFVEPPAPARVSLGVSALAQQGPLPTLAPRLGVTAGLEWDHWTGLLSLRAGLPTIVPGGPTPEARVVVQPILGGQLSLGWLWHAGPFSAGPCAIFGAEAWEVTGENVTRPRRATVASVVAGLDARAALSLWSGLSITAALGGRVALVRPTIFFQDFGTVFEASAFSAEGELGLRWLW